MTAARRNLVVLFWLLTLALSGAATIWVFRYTPVEATMGPIQKIFYLHLPSAICTFFACLTCFVASIGYLAQRKTRWDDLAAASAQVAVVLCSVVLATGMIWGHSAWGHWWTWSPRLTFSLVLWLLYVVYLMVRMSIESGHRRAVVGAVYGIIAFLDVPLVWLSTRLMVDIHPTSIVLAPAMKVTLGLCFVPVVLLAAGLLGWRFERIRTARAAKATPSLEPPATGFQWAGGEA
jgi:heme exporter protein C